VSHAVIDMLLTNVLAFVLEEDILSTCCNEDDVM